MKRQGLIFLGFFLELLGIIARCFSSIFSKGFSQTVSEFDETCPVGSGIFFYARIDLVCQKKNSYGLVSRQNFTSEFNLINK